MDSILSGRIGSFEWLLNGETKEFGADGAWILNSPMPSPKIWSADRIENGPGATPADCGPRLLFLDFSSGHFACFYPIATGEVRDLYENASEPEYAIAGAVAACEFGTKVDESGFFTFIEYLGVFDSSDVQKALVPMLESAAAGVEGTTEAMRGLILGDRDPSAATKSSVRSLAAEIRELRAQRAVTQSVFEHHLGCVYDRLRGERGLSHAAAITELEDETLEQFSGEEIETILQR